MATVVSDIIITVIVQYITSLIILTQSRVILKDFFFIINIHMFTCIWLSKININMKWTSETKGHCYFLYIKKHNNNKKIVWN